VDIREVDLAFVTSERVKEILVEEGDRVKSGEVVARLDDAKLRAAQEAFRLAVLGPRAEDIAEAKATLESMRANLDLAKQRLADATLAAPADAVVRDRILQPGDMVSPQNPVLTLALLNPVWVRAYVPEPDLGRIAPGMQAEIRTDSYPGKAYQGWVDFISPTAEFTPKNVQTPDLRTRLVYQVRVFACNPQDQLRLGMPATATIRLDQPKAPAKAVNHCGE
jgi:HlyD family secretion protein